MFLQMLLVGVALLFFPWPATYLHYLMYRHGHWVGRWHLRRGYHVCVGLARQTRQGTAMGIFGAGDAGAAITNLVAPMAVISFGS